MTPVLVKNDIEQFRNILTCHLGLQFEDEKLDYLADVMLQRMQPVGRARFESCSACLSACCAARAIPIFPPHKIRPK